MADAMEIMSANGTPAISPPHTLHQLYIWLGGVMVIFGHQWARRQLPGYPQLPTPPRKFGVVILIIVMIITTNHPHVIASADKGISPGTVAALLGLS